MAKVGRVVTDPKVGSYCQIKLDSGERILLNHDTGGSGRLVVEVPKLMGLSSDRIFSCDLGGAGGAAVLARLAAVSAQDATRPAPLAALVEYLESSPNVTEVKARCEALGRTT